MLAIINAELVLRDHLIPEAVLFIEDGIITGFGEIRSTPIPEGCEIIDAKGLYVGPGLVDIHTHTGGDYRLWQDPLPAAKFQMQTAAVPLELRLFIVFDLFLSPHVRFSPHTLTFSFLSLTIKPKNSGRLYDEIWHCCPHHWRPVQLSGMAHRGPV